MGMFIPHHNVMFFREVWKENVVTDVVNILPITVGVYKELLKILRESQKIIRGRPTGLPSVNTIINHINDVAKIEAI